MFEAGVKGFQNAEAGVNSAAKNIAEQGTNGQVNLNISNDVLALKTSELQAKASAEVISRANSMLGSIIDIYV